MPSDESEKSSLENEKRSTDNRALEFSFAYEPRRDRVEVLHA